MTKAIYYSSKLQKYYFCGTNPYTGKYESVTVYNGEALKGGDIHTDKNGKLYILGNVERVKGKNGYYWKCTGHISKITEESAF